MTISAEDMTEATEIAFNLMFIRLSERHKPHLRQDALERVARRLADLADEAGPLSKTP
jgi:hypothetical protein